MSKKINIMPSNKEKETRVKLIEKFLQNPIPSDQILENLEVFMRPQRISEILTLFALYKKIVEVPGVIMEFGVRWGRHISLFHAFRSKLEPYNMYRKIVGFDTFAGFLEPSKQDGIFDRTFKGSMSVGENYEQYLEEIMQLHEREAPLDHISRTELCKGDAPVMLEKYLLDHPETVIAFAYFDMDLYLPTIKCLELVMSHVTKGSIIAFDELLHPQFPGETIAFKEYIKSTNYTCSLRKIEGTAYPSFFVVEA